jgi:hypothetical protein
MEHAWLLWIWDPTAFALKLAGLNTTSFTEPNT